MSRPPAVEPFDFALGDFEPSIAEGYSMADELGRPAKPSHKIPSRKTVAPLRPATLRLTPDGVVYSSMSAKVLLRFHREGRLPLIKIGRRYLVTVADLDALMSALRKKR